MFVFQPPGPTDGQVRVPIRALDPSRVYHVKASGGEEWEASGAALLREGLLRTLSPGRSEVLLFRPV